MDHNVTKEDRRRVYTTALLLSLPFVVIAANSYIDAFFVTLNGKTAVQAYTLALPIESMLLATGAVISAIVSVRIRECLLNGDVTRARSHAIRSVVYSVPAAFVVIFILMVAGSLIVGPFVPDDVSDSLSAFLAPFLVFFAVITLNSIMCGIMVAQGMKRYYVVCLVMSLLFNAVFDKVFVGILDMGVLGNALGTLTGVAFSLVTALYALGRPGVVVPLSLKYFSHSRRDLRHLFVEIRGPLSMVFVKYLSEFVIRLSLFTAYAMTYGVPMLYVAMITVIGSAVSTSLAFEFDRCYEKRDVDGAYAVFCHYIPRMFLLMLVCSFAVMVLADPLVQVFTTHVEMWESREVMVRTTEVLCFAAPFTGLRVMTSPIYEPVGKTRYTSKAYFVWKVVRVVFFILVLQISFPAAIYYIMAESIFLGTAGLLYSRRFLLRNYRPE